MRKIKEFNLKQLSYILILLLELIAMLMIVVCVNIKGPENIDHMMMLNIGMDEASMMIGLVILVCSYIDLQRGVGDDRIFRILVHAAFVGVFTDAGAWLMYGDPSMRILSIIDNTIFFLATPISCYFFWNYVVRSMRPHSPAIKMFDAIVKAFALWEIFLCLYNVYSGIFFSIDEMGRYNRGSHHLMFMLYVIAVGLSVLFLVFLQRKKFSKRQIIVIIIYVLTPLPVVVFSTFAYGLSANFVMGMMDFLIMYVILNIEQGRKKVAFEKELATAASIQEGVLPSTFPLFPEREEFDVYASMDPAKEVGGDFYDVFFTDKDHLVLVVGDVAGKGIPAALFMLMARTLIKSRSQMGGVPSEIIKDVNLRLFEENKAKMFVTIWMAIVELSTGHVMEVNAGHECPAIKRVGGDYELIKTKHDLVVGGRKKTTYHDLEYDLSPGDAVFIYTDGVPEASDKSRSMYGTDRMIEALNAHKKDSPEGLLKHIRESIDAFVGDADQFDDLTMMSFVYKG